MAKTKVVGSKAAKAAADRAAAGPKKPKKLGVSTATKKAMDKAQAGSNAGINVTAYNDMEREVFKQEDILSTLKAEHMNACKVPQAAIKAAKLRARDRGMNMEVANLKLKLQRRLRANERDRANAETDTSAMLRELEVARKELGPLAETSLGKAHLERVRAKATKDFSTSNGGEDDPRPRHLKDAEAQRIAENTKALTEGISELH